MSSNWDISWKLQPWRQESPIPSPLQQQATERKKAVSGGSQKNSISSNKQEPASWPWIFAPNWQSPDTGYVTYQQPEANNSSSGLHCQRQPDTISLEQVRKHHKGGTGTKDFIPGFIARNSASAYQFLLADKTTCKISSLWWPPRVWAGLLDLQPKGCQAANGTLFMQAAFTICQSLEICLHQPSRHNKISVFFRGYQGKGTSWEFLKFATIFYLQLTANDM